ncbi:UbiH/UbiF/VisC/COQ6 family ubiquinone biosynthesis hydroxylase [Legionella maioricensis]|uniref:UbiH/UbiF/VisC/COQ6 family ubiquinone biosynthesis hydroxylase n=1 Tax=Legionella maioricensis TaxID=2896528 RepID=A0A9X2D182_9GAMM|nr:UbiH/UbiF/VisC/COQ6 family ubiquinone biosynthesis hydroxylase [Legionella maioricensis]MCL9684526.1 UbiH/UbiF/VisC/COQ6 family ubiquinone biosynthesis hydroxylase [Legionella maioricensis]MCL9687880.1 UbiH/UbiF/VisC/COQ6 family ubiquinone biosynthesis hydroxylase [Legionella maioricensis]
MSQHFDVLIVGGGIVGLTAALAMAQHHYTVAVIDAGTLKADTSGVDSRVYAINKASQALLLELGVWQHLDASRVSPYKKMHVWDGVNGASIDFDSRSIAAPDLGAIIEESVLKQALLQQIISEEKISLFPHCSVDEVCSSIQGVQISSQNVVWSGQLLMIADGANSPTRQKLNVELTTWPYHQKALVATVQIEKTHQQTAYQVFNPDGPLAFLPLSDPHQCSIVWSTNAERAQQLIALDEEAFNAELTQAFAAYLGHVTLVSTRYQFPLQMRHVKQYSGNRWLLLGDAAHTIHPLAGLGLNVGLADVRCWLQLLEASNGALPSRKILNAYQRERKSAVWQIILLMEGFKWLFGYSLAPVAALRGLGLRICNGITPLKRLFIQHASG